MDVQLGVCGSLQHLKAVRAALSGHRLRLLSIHSGDSHIWHTSSGSGYRGSFG